MLTFDGKPSAVIQAGELRVGLNRAVLLDCRPLEDYEDCHYEGALHVDVESALSSAAEPSHNPANGGRNPLPKPEAWERQLRGWGLRHDSFVVAYDDGYGAEGASRAWWMLTASGIRAAVLDGGWGASLKEGLPLSQAILEPTPSDIKFDKWLLPTVDMDAVDKLRRSPDWVLLDSRAPTRWLGESEMIDPIPGRIPGSKNIFFKENLVESYFKKPVELRKIYLEILGGTPPSRVIASCGSGMTACHTLVALHQAGLSGASLYVGSYSEWCRNRPDCK
jgi:thiosulfate/3-mercaptopyruvate sulfurtransferase